MKRTILCVLAVSAFVMLAVVFVAAGSASRSAPRTSAHPLVSASEVGKWTNTRDISGPVAPLGEGVTVNVGTTPHPVVVTWSADFVNNDRMLVQFTVNGRTVDIQAYTRFLRQLEASPWITEVTPVSAQTVVEKERPVTAFSIRATYRQADSAYIRTVPLSQSVR